MIYLDNNATTRLDSRILDAMMPYFGEEYGNPSSAHKHGLKAMLAVDKARDDIAGVLGAHSSEIFFTSGATESNNTVLKGSYFKAIQQGNVKPHYIVGAIEHKCVLNAAHFLESLGAEVSYVAPSNEGVINVDDVAEAIRPNTVLVSLMWANNEIGSINPINEIAAVCQKAGVLFHTDAAQAIGKLTVNTSKTSIDFLTGSAHKFYGPKGVGLLYIKRDSRDSIEPLLHGGGQEDGVRSGTLNVPGIVGMAHTVKLFCSEQYVVGESQRQHVLAETLYQGLKVIAPNIQLNGPPIGHSRLSNNVNVSLPSINEKIFNKKIKGLMISSGSACSSAELKASYVLTGIGLPELLAFKSYRIGLGKDTTPEEVNDALKILSDAYEASI